MTERGKLVKIKDECIFYRHQVDGVRSLARQSSFLLADEMGLGKSLQALTVAAIDFELNLAKRVLIVCPATLKGNWLDEIAEHTNFKALMLDGKPSDRVDQLVQFLIGNYDILIINYEQVKPHIKELKNLNFDIAIWDEAHYLKNHKSQRTKASLQLLGIRRRFLLTGSPLLNRPDELWTLLHICQPDKYPDWFRFRNKYCILGGYQNKEVVGTKNRKQLMMGVEQVMTRRYKKDVLDLPDKQNITLKVDLTNEQRVLYKEALEDLKITLPGSPNPMELENALVKFLRLKQICGSTFSFTGEDHSSKLDRAEEVIQEIIDQDEHLVVFSQFLAIQNLMGERLRKRGITPRILNGTTHPKASERAPYVRQWAESPPGVLIAGLQVAGIGLNMTAANKCIFLDKLFVPMLNTQAEDRLHRIGADKVKPIQIYSLVCRNTVELRVEAILRKKTKLFDSLIEGPNMKKEIYKIIREEAEMADAA